MSPQRLDTFKKCVKAEKIKSKAFIGIDVATRWKSTWEMLDKEEKFEKPFNRYDVDDPNYKNDMGDDAPRVSDWNYARQLASVLELFQRKIANASATKTVTVNLFFNEVMDIDKHLRKMKDGSDLEGKLMGAKIHLKFDKYWRNLPTGRSFNYILYFAANLDPRLKVRVIQFGFERIFRAEKKDDETEDDLKKRVKIVVNSIKDELKLLYEHYASSSEKQGSDKVSPSQENSEPSSLGESDFFTEFKADGGSTSYNTKSELERYLDDGEEAHYKGFDILGWWKVASSKYPVLAKMAKDFLPITIDILAILVSSVASKEAFSTGGRVVDTYQTTLSTPIIEALICTEDWIRALIKKKIYIEDSVEFDDIGKEIYDKVEPDHMNIDVD
ncbi:zinc finger BED domain-containing protein RICESLEEPER 2-like [Helianthus annuus]|uniref:zinc finger BED domain-containing protein RICESLEEPER 2-like n=1 Tax=Helianthus annuus TaxID=4232 RepID=UPI001652EAF1|nr:zinc finger BED domain-containing protein RICESLEEPER 2-like [Helianthus annuus]